MNKEENKQNMKCHVKGQRGGSSFELPQVKSSFELARELNIKLEERKAKPGKISAPIKEVEALRNKKNQPSTTSQFKLSMFATTSNKEPEPKKNVSDNASRTKLPNIHAEKSIEREVSLKQNKGLKIQDPKDQSLASKIKNSKGQSLSQGRTPMHIHIQNPNRQSMKKVAIGNGALERQQIVENKSVENDITRSREQSRRMVVENDTSRLKEKHESNKKNQPQKMKKIGNDISRENDQQKKMPVAEEESRAREQSGRKKTKRSALCQSMSIGEFLKQNGRDVEKEMENVIEDEENIVLEEHEEDGETNGTTKKRTRGPTRCLQIYARDVKDRQEVTLDEFGEPIGPTDQTVSDLGNFLGTIARNANFCPLIYTNFKELLKVETNPELDSYRRIWKYINTKFNIPERGQKIVYSRINDAWRRHKYFIKKNHFEKYSNMNDRLKYRPKSISEDHFKELLVYWRNKHIEDISRKNAVNRRKQKFMHRAGPINFARIRAKMRESRDGQEVTQAEMFIATRKSRKGKQVAEETQFAIDKLQESLENSIEAGTQTFQSLFGKEKPGRVRCYGRTVTPSLLKKNEEISLIKKQYDGQISHMSQKMGAMEALLKSMYMQQNPHLTKDEVDAKMREALHGDNILTPCSSTSTYAPARPKVRNEDGPHEDEQDDDDLHYDQDDDDLQYDQDDDLQYDEVDGSQDGDSQYNEYDEDRH